MMQYKFKSFLLRIYILFSEFGFDFYKMFLTPISITRYLKNLFLFKKELKKNKSENFKIELIPRLNDHNQIAGGYENEYFITDLFISQYISKESPGIESLLDVGSRVDGLVSHISCFREITIIDIRDVPSKFKNIKSMKLDMTQNFKMNGRKKYDAITSNHAIEHFGLGRYGDPVDFNGHIKAIKNIHKLLKEEGLFILGVPYSKENKIFFDCHRELSINKWSKILISSGFTIKEKYSQYKDEWPKIYKNSLSKEKGMIIFFCIKS